MKLSQDKVFKPLIITLETPEEFESFFKIMKVALNPGMPVGFGEMEKTMAGRLCEYGINNS